MAIIKPLSRRTFLRGTGVALALPFLEAMLPMNQSWAAEPLRFGTFIKGNGLHLDPGTWTPQLLNILQPYSSHSTFLTNVENAGYGIIGRGKFDNHKEFKSLMSGQPEFLGKTSVDQMLAPRINPPSLLFPSGLHLGTNAISQKDGVTLPKYLDPRDVFDLMTRVGGSTGGPSPQAAFRGSVLDATKESIKSLRTKLGSTDKAILDQHLNSLEQMERSLATVPSANSCTIPNVEDIDYKPYEAFPILMDLAALAIKCDLTRVITVNFAASGAGRRDLYEFLKPVVNFPATSTWVSYHSWTHNRIANCLNDNNSTGCQGGQATAKRYMRLADEYEARLFARFLSQIKDVPGLLDNSGFVFGSGGAPGGFHNGRNMPFCLVGKVGNKIKPTGQAMNDLTGMKINNVWLTLLRNYGLNLNSFGSDDPDYFYNPTVAARIGA